MKEDGSFKSKSSQAPYGQRERQKPNHYVVTSQAHLNRHDDQEALAAAIQHHRNALWRSKGNLKGDTTITVTLSTASMMTSLNSRDFSRYTNEQEREPRPKRSRNVATFLLFATLVVSVLVAACFGNGSFGRKLSSWIFGRASLDYYDRGPGKDLWLESEHYKIILPQVLERSFVDITNTTMDIKTTPFFWKIPKSGGSVVSKAMTECFQMVGASDAGKDHEEDINLKVYTSVRSTKVGTIRSKLVNVDTSTLEGIERARNFELVPSGLADVIESMFLYEAALLFELPLHAGRAFVLLRHPVYRAESIYRRMSTSGNSVDGTKVTDVMDISEYFSPGSGQYVEDNYLVRTLTNLPTTRREHLTEDDLLFAMAVLRRKFLVGFVDDIVGSIARFRWYFRWRSNESDEEPDPEECLAYLTRPMVDSYSAKSELVEGTPEWNLILTYNQWDLQLYEFAKILYNEQDEMLSST